MQYLLVACLVLSKVLGSIALPIEVTETAAVIPTEPVEVKLHDYFYNIFQLIRNDSDCNSSYNCQKISSHWCNANIIRSFKAAAAQTDDATGQECILKFSLSFSLIETVIGADLALYRLPLAKPSENQTTTYTVFIYEQFENDEDHLVTSKEIGCETEYWEVFHIDEAARSWTVGQSSTQFKINATDSNGNWLSNYESLSMFILSEETCAIEGTTNDDNYICPNSQKTFQPIITAFVDSKTPTDFGDTHCQENPDDCISNDRDTATEETATTVPPTDSAKNDDDDEEVETDIDNNKNNLIDDALRRLLAQKPTKKRALQYNNNVLEPTTKRSVSDKHSYIHMLLQNRRQWQAADCETDFNCMPVSSHHCSSSPFATAKLSGVEEVVYADLGCDLNFTVHLSERDKKEGMDIALYRREDYQLDPDYYYIVIIIYERGGGPYSQDVAVASYFSCEGWQVFSIDSVANIVSDTGDNSITLKLVAYKSNKYIEYNFEELDCYETASIFVLEDTYFTEEGPSQTIPPTPVTESTKLSGDTPQRMNCDEFKDSQPMMSGDCEDAGSKEDMSLLDEKEVNVVERSLAEYGPLVTFFLDSLDNPFASTFYKRNTLEHKTSRTMGKNAVCSVQDNIVQLSEKYPGMNIIDPREANFGACTVVYNSLRTTSLTESVCKPTSYQNLDVLLEYNGRFTIETKYDAIIKSCGYT